MSSIFSHFMKIYRLKLKTQRPNFHYKHGIPGIPVNGKVVLLNNSSNGSQIYLVGSKHNSKEYADTVKKVINHVRPDSVAIELCMERARLMLEYASEDDDFYTMYLRYRIIPGGFWMKVGTFVRCCWHLFQGDVRLSSGMDMEVAMKESFRLGAECFFIDQDAYVFDKEINHLLTSDESIRRSYDKYVHECTQLLKRRKTTRATVREVNRIENETCPEIYKLLTENRDILMFTRLREMERKLIVAVVGLAHMDGIELLWKRAEGDDDVQPLGATSEDVDQQNSDPSPAA